MQSFAFKRESSLGIGLVIAIALLLAAPLVAVAQDMTDEDSVIISIRLYSGLNQDDMDELYRRTAEGFLDIIRESDGFIAFYWLHSGENVAAINLFATEEQASASNEAARDYVAEHLAGLVPGPPVIVEGAVDIGFVEMLHGMSDDDVNSLYASIRIYDDFAAEHVDEFATIIEDGFLPLMRETDGFFGYYLMHAGDGKAAVISLFDSETTALASNEQARDFVAENLTAFLPSSPLIISGRVGVAALADVNEGANLIDDMMEEQTVFVSVRVYDGVDPGDRDEIIRVIDEGFLPIMRESDRFVAYYLLPAGDMVAAISLFRSAEQASASNEKARDYVAEYMAPLLPNLPHVVEGLVDLMYVAAHDEMMADDGVTALYAALRIYDNYDLSRLAEANEVVEALLLPAQQAAGGLFSYFSLNDGVDTVAGLSVYDTEVKALAANDIAAAIVKELMSEWLPDDPLRINGRLGVAALAGVHDGANLIDAMTGDG